MPAKKNTTISETFLTITELAERTGRDRSLLSRWEKAGTIIKTDAGYPLLENFRRIVDHLCTTSQQKAATNSEKIAEQVRNLRLDAEAKERARKKDEHEWLEAAVWLDKISEHLGDLRAKIKILLLTDQPGSLCGRSEVDIRESNGKTYTQLCRWLQNAATKLRPPGSNALTIQPE